jgi:hypothetical protein
VAATGINVRSALMPVRWNDMLVQTLARLRNLRNSLVLSVRVRQTRPIAGILKRTHVVLKYVTVTGLLAAVPQNIEFGILFGSYGRREPFQHL